MKKTFDAVAFQRRVREKLSAEYSADPKAFRRKLKGHGRKRRARKSDRARQDTAAP